MMVNFAIRIIYYSIVFVLLIIDILIRVRNLIFRLARRLPVVQRKIAEARESTLTSVCNDMAKSIAGHKFIKSLPIQGFSQVKFSFLPKKYNSLVEFRRNFVTNLNNIENMKLIFNQEKSLDVSTNYPKTI